MMQLQSNRHDWSISHKLIRLAWLITWGLFGYHGPRFFSNWRVFLLRVFGAKIGLAPLICSKVKILMPWNLVLGNYVAISEGVNIYNFAIVKIGDNTCLSQSVWLCTGSHNYAKPDFPLIWKPITVGCSVWIATETFVSPGVEIGNGAVIGARSVVTKNMPEWMVCAGNPCKPIKTRTIQSL